MIKVRCLPCPVCGLRGEVQLTDREFTRWRDGAPLDSAVPRLSDDERELLITGTHGDCWDKMFQDEDVECSECDKHEAFLDDPMTVFYGIGSEMAPMFKHRCPRELLN